MQRVLGGERSTPTPTPSETTTGDGYRWYTVKEHDTLWGIAAENLGPLRYKVDRHSGIEQGIAQGPGDCSPRSDCAFPPKEVASAGQ